MTENIEGAAMTIALGTILKSNRSNWGNVTRRIVGFVDAEGKPPLTPAAAWLALTMTPENRRTRIKISTIYEHKPKGDKNWSKGWSVVP